MKRLSVMALIISVGILSTPVLLANHPVLVEGNCDSPVPFTTLVSPGTCGDFDGDGRIGTAEDTDGADRIFGTIAAALGPGTGAAAGTGATNNGTVTIVASGRFPETIVIAPMTGNVTIEAAPGVRAAIDAVLQGDSAANNNARQAASGITVDALATSKVVLRNLTIRNFAEGLTALNNSRVSVENCVFEHNLNFGLRAAGSSRLHVTGCSIQGTGFRVGGAPNNTATPGNAIQYEGTAKGAVVKTSIVGSAAVGLSNQSSAGAIIFYELTYGDNGGGMFAGSVQRTEF